MELVWRLFLNYLKTGGAADEICCFEEFERIIKSECYEVIRKIINVIRDDKLEDEECFSKIEEIVCIFERMGISAHGRHDF